MTSFSMLRACALVIGPLGPCGGDGVSVRVVEGCSASPTLLLQGKLVLVLDLLLSVTYEYDAAKLSL